MPDFEKPTASNDEVFETGEEIPTPEEIAELEAETNELAQEATGLTEELNAIVDNPETTEEQLGYLETKAGELKMLWDNLYDKSSFLMQTGVSAAGATVVGMSAHIASEAATMRIEDTYTGLAVLGAFLVTPLIGNLIYKIKEAKNRVEQKEKDEEIAKLEKEFEGLI